MNPRIRCALSLAAWLVSGAPGASAAPAAKFHSRAGDIARLPADGIASRTTDSHRHAEDPQPAAGPRLFLGMEGTAVARLAREPLFQKSHDALSIVPAAVLPADTDSAP